jgi:hypothetical protein
LSNQGSVICRERRAPDLRPDLLDLLDLLDLVFVFFHRQSFDNYVCKRNSSLIYPGAIPFTIEVIVNLPSAVSETTS